jgi:23S rRNA (cytidine2498-2'-O)-methyltransferase
MTLPSVQDSFGGSPQNSREDFAFLACQQGAENAIKRQLLVPDSAFRLAFSRPGLLTFKVHQPEPVAELALPRHPLVRQSGWVMGQVRGESAEQMAEQATRLSGSEWDGLHVFQRDSLLPGAKGFEPGQSPLAIEIGRWMLGKLERPLPLNQPCQPGSKILDLILVEPNHWIVGTHQAVEADPLSCWPGGVLAVSRPQRMISRAYLKIAEAIAWSRLPLEAGDRIVEIGCAPGGSAQRLLDMGLIVTGVDPAEIDLELIEHPRFTHWRAKAAAVKRKNYSRFRWLAADANVAPNYTLDCVEDIVRYPTSRLEGVLLTLKLSDYRLVENLPEYLNRIREWGFQRVEARQLAHNRRELFVVGHRTEPTDERADLPKST